MEMEDWIVLRLPEEVPMDGSFSIAGEEAAEASIALTTIPQSAVSDLERDPRILAAAPNMPTKLIEPLAASASSAGDAWGVVATGADASGFDGSGVKVAVLDTGIDAAHPAFAGMRLVERDFTGSGDGDRKGHGTHCAGTIFGRDVGQRIGMARGVDEAFIGKVLGDDGRGTTHMALDGIQWASREGANIISMSLGFDVSGMVARLIASGWPSQLAAAIGLDSYRKNIRLFDRQLSLLVAQEEIGRNCLVVAATGNESRRDQDPKFRIPASLPAAAEGVLSVGALGRTPAGLRVASFSNSLPLISAPGVDILSAWPGGGTKSLQGTSMACPHVAGIAALWWESMGSAASAAKVKAKLEALASFADLAPGYDHSDVGNGLVRAP